MLSIGFYRDLYKLQLTFVYASDRIARSLYRTLYDQTRKHFVFGYKLRAIRSEA